MEAKKMMNTTILAFGLLFGIVMILFFILSPPTQDPETSNKSIFDIVGLVVYISIPIFAVRYYKQKDSDLTLGKSVKIGILLGLLGGLIVGIYSYFYFANNPDAVDKVIEISRKILEEKDKYSEEFIDGKMETLREIFLPMQIVGNMLVGGFLYGLIGGLLGGLFFKTPNEDY